MLINNELLNQVCLQLVLDLGVPLMMLLATLRMLMTGYDQCFPVKSLWVKEPLYNINIQCFNCAKVFYRGLHLMSLLKV